MSSRGAGGARRRRQTRTRTRYAKPYAFTEKRSFVAYFMRAVRLSRGRTRRVSLGRRVQNEIKHATLPCRARGPSRQKMRHRP